MRKPALNPGATRIWPLTGTEVRLGPATNATGESSGCHTNANIANASG